uniref:Isocitrate dehydrogenase (NAD(+)) 3 non-catalytic subunit gamma n=1 Tax=Cyprinus carpio TaxID=7962 RepID=A0A8C1W7I6_CYPCA
TFSLQNTESDIHKVRSGKGALIASLCDSDKVSPPPAEYGGRRTVTLVPGDGIGPELLNHIRELLRFEDEALYKQTSPENNKVALLCFYHSAIFTDSAVCLWILRLSGWIHLKRYSGLCTCILASSDGLKLKYLDDLFFILIHLPTHHNDTDIIIIRENTEGEYSSLEHKNVPGVVECLKIITRVKSLRIAELFFSVLHRNLGDGLFLQCCKEVAAGYPEITFDNMIVDPKPQQFVVMELCNLYESVVRNVCAGLVGGRGLVPGVNYGKDYTVFETVRKNRVMSVDRSYKIANPTATLLASCLMLDQLKFICFHMSLYLLSLQLQTVDLGGQGYSI